MKRAVVIGGGITGLSALYYLQKLKVEHSLDIDLVLVEKQNGLGGKIHTISDGQFLMEGGADSIVARLESVQSLIQELKLENQVVYNETGISYLFSHNELHAIPHDTVFGIPTSESSLFRSTLVSEEGKKRALLDYELPNETFTLKSSIGEFLEHFLGKELVEKQIAPVLSGVYSGKLEELSIESTLPYLLHYKNEYGSIMKGLEENKLKFLGNSDKKFISFENGLSTLIDELEKSLSNCAILTGTTTERIIELNGKYEVSFANHESMEADYVVLTTPHDVTQNILANDELDDEFNRLSNSSLTSVYIGFDLPDENLPADGTGFIVNNSDKVKCEACTWTSRKWKHTSKNRNLLVRLFYKASSKYYQEISKSSEQELVQIALSDIKESLRIEAEPVAVKVTKWEHQMPIYNLDHSKAVKSITDKLENVYPNVLIGGCSYYGVGIGACIQNGKELAENIYYKISKA